MGAGHVQVHVEGTPKKAPKLGKPLIQFRLFKMGDATRHALFEVALYAMALTVVIRQTQP